MEKSRRKQKKSRGSCSACIDRDNALYYLLNIIYRHFHVNLPWELRFHCRPIETFPPWSILLFILFVFLLMFLINCAAAISQFQQTSSLLGLYIFYIYVPELYEYESSYAKKNNCVWTPSFTTFDAIETYLFYFANFFHDKTLFS